MQWQKKQKKQASTTEQKLNDLETFSFEKYINGNASNCLLFFMATVRKCSVEKLLQSKPNLRISQID